VVASRLSRLEDPSRFESGTGALYVGDPPMRSRNLYATRRGCLRERGGTNHSTGYGELVDAASRGTGS
jgi:hypothetical protein